MKSTNCETKDAKDSLKSRIGKKAADVLMKRGIEEQVCVVYFTYESEIPVDILMSQKAD